MILFLIMYVYSIKKFAHSGQNNPNWQGVGDMPRSMWSRILKNAASRNIPVLMTIEDAERKLHEQEWLCALTGQPLTMTSPSRGKEMNASLDRRDSDLPYTIENTQWVTKEINTLKWNLKQDYFIEICRAIDNHAKSRVL